MRRRTVNYLSNKNLLEEIHKSKISYCEYSDAKYTIYDHITEDINDLYNDELINALIKKKEEITGTSPISKTDLVFRIHTYEHIPTKFHKINKQANSEEDYCRLNFVPFKHYAFNEDGELVTVLTSHSKNGKFCDTHGQLTNTLANMFILLIDRYSQRPNWRGYSYLDEMMGNALLQLSQFALQFNELKSQNPFAYYTQFLSNAFTRVLLIEQKHQAIRDNLLEENGHAPSNTRQLDNEEAINVSKNAHFSDDV